ncbi:MAG TPA: hypothetical protein VL175_13120 [Pirellulales bacterium]|jgi:hypothetical protein|nr:hypothetical protein [Pirellulales bacterium]
MSQDEHLPEELNDCQRLLASLAPRASRIDRDRLMIRLGEQSAAGGSVPWKWATAASLMLALVLGLRPALVSQESATRQLATHSSKDAPQAYHPETLRPEPNDGAPPPTRRSIDNEADWLLAVASGEFDPARTLTVRPRFATAVLASRPNDAQVLDNSPDPSPPVRTPMLRWGDRPLRRDAADLTAPPTS